nr:MAG: inositol monophosphatase [Bacillota bacterium]
MEPSMLAAYEEAAVRAAREAGRLIREQYGRVGYETKSNPHDMVTAVDRASEETIARILTDTFPGIPFLGEEGVAGRQGVAVPGDRPPESLPELWVVDPIDGTMNFVYGLPFSSVSIALVRHGEPVVGVVYDPYRDEVFTARKGEGAWLNGKPIRVRPAPSLGDALVATGYPADGEARRPLLAGVHALAAQTRNLRSMGSAALHLAYVACGRLNLFYELYLNPWDIAAGVLMVQEAGGKVTDTLGRPYTLATRHPVASCGEPVHSEALWVLRDAGGTGF